MAPERMSWFTREDHAAVRREFKENFPRLENLERRLTESEFFDRMARVVILRSKPIDQVKKELENAKNLTDVFLTTAIFVEKNENSSIPHNILAAGGHVEDGETSEQAGVRELLEETHLRPLAIKPVGTNEFNYIKDGKKIAVDADYFVADIVPTDQAYPLTAAEEKIQAFHYLDLEGMLKLFLAGSEFKNDEKGARTISIVDSLRVKHTKDSKVHDEQAFELQKNIVDALQAKELEKNVNVFRHLVDLSIRENIFDSAVTEKRKWLGRLLTIKSLGEYYALLAEFNEEFSSKGDLRTIYIAAIDLSNFEEEVVPREDGTNPLGSSKVEAVLRLMYTMLESKHYYDDYLEIAGQNPLISDFVDKIKLFSKLVAKGVNDRAGTYAEQIGLIGDLDNDDERAEEIEKIFIKVFKLGNADEITERIARIDSFLGEVAKKAIEPKVADTHQREHIDEYEELKGNRLRDLIFAAFPQKIEALKMAKDAFREYDKYGKPVDTLSLKKYVFEARRKLALLYLFRDVDALYDETLYEQTKVPLEKSVYKPMLQGIRRCQVQTEYETKNGNKEVLKNINIHFDVSEEEAAARGMQHTMLRRMVGDQKLWYVKMKTRPKSIESVDRKMITRGFDDPKFINDFFGRAIVLVSPASENESELGRLEDEARMIHRMPIKVARFNEKEETFNAVDLANGMLPLYLSDKQNSLRPAQQEDYGRLCVSKKDGKTIMVPFEECGGVLDVIKAVARNTNVRIFDYKPTPRIGEKMVSSGVGGGGDIRLAKFYIEYTDKNGKIHYEEVQIFSPSEDGKSGSYYLEMKEQDDKRYFLDRLLVTKGLRSFVEILYPTGLYGAPIHRMYENKKKKKR